MMTPAQAAAADCHRTETYLAHRREIAALLGRMPTASPEEAREIADRLHALRAAALRLAASGQSSFFKDHRCWKCKNGQRPCALGGHHQCDYPRARND